MDFVAFRRGFKLRLVAFAGKKVFEIAANEAEFLLALFSCLIVARRFGLSTNLTTPLSTCISDLTGASAWRSMS
jgi:hypothetical protein